MAKIKKIDLNIVMAIVPAIGLFLLSHILCIKYVEGGTFVFTGLSIVLLFVALTNIVDGSSPEYKANPTMAKILLTISSALMFGVSSAFIHPLI